MIKRKEVKKLLSLDSLGPGEKSRLLDCETLELDKVSALTITVRCTHNAAATKALRVHLKSGVDTMVWDTSDYTYFDMDLDAGTEVQKTVAITPDVYYLKVQLENQDTSYAVTDIDVWATVGYED
jgi:hypothetical protein